MVNSSGFTTLTPIGLQRTCFTSEEDRLQEFAKSLRVPIQTGEIIKGDPGAPGAKGETGAQGPAGASGTTPKMTSLDIDVPVSATTVPVTGDIRHKTVNLFYSDLTIVPPTYIGILCLVYDLANTHVVLTAPAPNEHFKIKITTFA